MTPFFANNDVLYEVDIELGVIVAFVYIVAYVLAFLINEFVKSWLRYPLLILFTGSFAAMWYVLLLDNSLIQRLIILGVILFGSMSGFWHFIGDLYRAINKS